MLSRRRERFALAVGRRGRAAAAPKATEREVGQRRTQESKGGADVQSADVNENLEQERGAGKPANKKRHKGTMANAMRNNRDEKTMWAAARERLRRELGDPVFNSWIGSLQLLSMEKGEVRIGATKPFVRNWVANHFAARIERALRAEGGEPRSISIVLAPASPHAAPELAPQATGGSPAIGSAPAQSHSTRGLWNRVLHPTQSFETLIVGGANEFAAGAAR